MSQGVQICPICQSRSFHKTDESYDITSTLYRWEKEGAITFSENVWDEFNHVDPCQVSLFECEYCLFEMFLPVVVGTNGFYDEISDIADGYYLSNKWEFRQAIDDLRANETAKVLDVGCGSGQFLSLLRAELPNVQAVGQEVSPAAAGRGLEDNLLILEGSFPEVVLQRSDLLPFDSICIFQVLEHVADPVVLLRDAWQILDEDGLLVVAVPDARGPTRHFRNSLTAIPPHHVSRWSAETFEKNAPSLGFKIEKLKYEPLPRYLWRSYLPPILERDLLPISIGRYMNNLKITTKIIRLLEMTNLQWIPGIPGHTLYVLLKKTKIYRKDPLKT